MSITFRELISLPQLESIQLLTQTAGLGNPVSGVGILDYEYAENMKDQFHPGDLVISSFLFAKGREDLLFASVRELIREGVTALGIKNVYFKSLSPELLAFARRHSFPIFLFDHRVMFEDIVTLITDSCRFSAAQQRDAAKLDMLLSPSASRGLVQDLTRELSPLFSEYFFCVYLRCSDDFLFLLRTAERLNSGHLLPSRCRVFVYREGLLAVFSSPEPPIGEPTAVLADLCRVAGLSPRSAGASRAGVRGLDQALREALWAFRLGDLSPKNVCFFGESGVYRLLLPASESPWARRYCADLLAPIEEYDKKYRTDLLITARRYVENHCSVKRTAEALFQHENTVRYRLSKIREVLGMDAEHSRFDLELSLAVLLSELSEL
jgi:DNA-binding PucR family transcriptional regulator